jgi:hypothetical protein
MKVPDRITAGRWRWPDLEQQVIGSVKHAREFGFERILSQRISPG